MRVPMSLRAALLAAILATLLAVSAPAGGQSSSPAERATSAFPPPAFADLQDQLERARADERSRIAKLPRVDRDAYADQTDAEAFRTLRRRFPGLVRKKVVPQLDQEKDTDQVDRYLANPNQAVVEEDGEKSLVQSALPLRVPTSDEASAKLQPLSTEVEETSEDGVIEPENVPSQYGIAAELGDDSELPGNASTWFDEARFGIVPKADGKALDSDDARVRSDKAIALNAAKDLDFITAAGAGGTQGLFVLRSGDAPRELAYRVVGDVTRLRRHRDGLGVEVLRDKTVIARLQAPVATDVNGTHVPVSWRVSGRELRLKVDLSDPDVQMPVVVDPSVVEDQRFWVNGANSAPNFTGWQFYSSPAGAYTGVQREGYYGFGLTVYSLNSKTYTTGTWGEWYFDAPVTAGFVSEGARITNVDYGYTAHLQAAGTGSCQQEGIYNRRDTRFSAGAYENGFWKPSTSTDTTAGTYTAYGGAFGRVNCLAEGQIYNTATYGQRSHGMTKPFGWGGSAQNSGTPGNTVVYGITNGQGRPSQNGLVYLGSSLIRMSEQAPPRLTVSGAPTGWVHTLPGSFSASATDYGLGMASLTATIPGSAAQSATAPSCIRAGLAPSDDRASSQTPNQGDRDNRCPQTLAKAGGFTLPTDSPEGSQAMRVTATDLMGNPATQDVPVKIDRSPPKLTQLDAGKTIYAQPPSGTTPAPPTKVTIDADDTQSGVKKVTVYVDGKLREGTAQPTCADGQCPTKFKVEIPGTELATGTHQVRVIATDQIPATGTPAIDKLHTVEETFSVTVVNQNSGGKRADEPGLGFEDWMTYDSTPTGAGSTHRVNLATGNSLWSVSPVSNPGIGFDTVLRLTYNSLEPVGALPGVLGPSGLLEYGVAGRGVSVQLGSITRLNEPLWIEGIAGVPLTLDRNANDASRIVLTDGDGTRHTFERRSGTGVRFKAPAGVHLELRRHAAENAPEGTPRFWAATRPDGSTFYFYRDGRASESEDRHGNVLRLEYEPRPGFANFTSPLQPGCGFTLVCTQQVSGIVDEAGEDRKDLADTVDIDEVEGIDEAERVKRAKARRRWTLKYDDQQRLLSVQDRKMINGARRTTTFSYDNNRLSSVTVAANAGVPEKQQRSWKLAWAPNTAYLSGVTDPENRSTRIRYSQPRPVTLVPPLDPLLQPVPVLYPLLGQVLGPLGLAQDYRTVDGVADRSSRLTNGTESREKVYRFEKPTTATQGPDTGQRLETFVRSARKISSRYTMDTTGRLRRVVEDLDDTTNPDDGAPIGTAHLKLGSEQTWDEQVNKVKTSTGGVLGDRGPQGTDPYDYAQATSTNYKWGPLGQLEKETEYAGKAQLTDTPSGEQRSRSWTYNVHNGGGTGFGDGDQQFVYDLAKTTDRRGKETNYDYTDATTGDVSKVRLPDGGEQTMAYDRRGLVISKATRQWKAIAGQTDERPEWAKADGSIAGDTAEGEFSTDRFEQFDSNGDARLRIDARDKRWRSLYDNVGNTTRAADPRIGPATATIDSSVGAEQTLAGSGDPAAGLADVRTQARKNGQAYVARFTYDALDRKVAEVIPKRSQEAAATTEDRFRITATSYDRNDNVVAERDPENNLTTRTFTDTDEIATQTAPSALQRTDASTTGFADGALEAPVTSYEYDQDDNQTVRKDPEPGKTNDPKAAGYRTLWTFDRLNRAVAQVREGKDGTVAERKTMSRAYDRRDNVIGEVDAQTNADAEPDAAAKNASDTTLEKLRYRYVYDIFDRKTEQVENPRTPKPGETNTDINRSTTWAYDPGDLETQQRTPAGRITKKKYDDRGDVIEIQEPFAHDPANATTTDWATTTIQRRRDGQPTAIVSPRGQDSAGDPVDDGGAFRTKLKYHETGQLWRRWTPRVKGQYGPEWLTDYTIDDVGDPFRVKDPRGDLVNNEFLNTGELSSTTRPSWWIFDQEQGRLRERTPEDPKPSDGAGGEDEGGLPMEPGNGDFGKLDPQQLPDMLPLKGDTSFGYDDRMLLRRVTGPRSTGTGHHSQLMEYDALGRLTKRTIPLRARKEDPLNPGVQLPEDLVLEWQYDVRGRTRASRQQRRALDGGSAVTTWRYDAHDRLISSTEPPSCQGASCTAPTTDQTWNRNDTIKTVDTPTKDNPKADSDDTTTGTRSYTYDLADRQTSVVDEAGARTEEQYDADDLVLKRYAPRAFVEKVDGKANEKFATGYRYDGAGRVTRERAQVTDPGGTTDLITDTTYDREGNATKVEAPGAKSSSTQTDVPRRVSETITDARGMPWKSTIGTGDDRSTTITEFDGMGNLRRNVNPQGVTGHGVDATPVAQDVNEKDSGVQGLAARHASVMTYDENQLLTGRTLPWDTADGAADEASRQRWRQVYERDPRGLVERITGIFDAGTGTGDPTWETRIEHNYAGWPISSKENRRRGSTFVRATEPLSYEYDESGNQTLWSSEGGSRTIQRTFYRSGQLRVKCGRRTAGGRQEQLYSYRYDTAGGLREVVDWMHHEAPTRTADTCQPGEQDDKPSGGLTPRDTAIRRDKAGRPVATDELWGSGKDTRFRYVPNTPNLVQSVQTNGVWTAPSAQNENGSYTGGTSMAYGYDEQDRNTLVRVRDGGSLSGTVARETNMAWWPSGERRQTKKPKTAGEERTTDDRYFDSRGQLIQRIVDPAASGKPTRTHKYAYDKNGNRTKDERSKLSAYNARDQLTKWERKRHNLDAQGMPRDTNEDDDQEPSPTERDPAQTITFSKIDGAGRAETVKTEIIAPQAGKSVKTVVDTTNIYDGDQLQQTERVTKAQFEDGTGDPTTTEQRDCFAYNVFGSQTQTYRQTKKDGTTIQACGTDATALPGKLEVRSVYDTFERLTAGRERKHEKVDKTDEGTLDGTQAFCFDPFDRRDRRLSGLTGAADPAGSNQDEEGRTRADAACRTAATGDVKAYDYSYLGQTEQLTRENRGGEVQSYEYTAAGERLGRLKTEDGKDPQWRSYDVDAQGTVVGLEAPDTGYATPEDRYDTDPFGSPIADETKLSGDAKANPFRFQGFYKDQETGTYDMQARSYRPDTNRFLQQDRFESANADLTLASDPFTNSRYAFTAGNPGTRSEYNGHCWGKLWDAMKQGFFGGICKQVRQSGGKTANRILDRALGATNHQRTVAARRLNKSNRIDPQGNVATVIATPENTKPTASLTGNTFTSYDDATGSGAGYVPHKKGAEVRRAWNVGAPIPKERVTLGSVASETFQKAGKLGVAIFAPDCSTVLNCAGSIPLAKVLKGKKIANAIEEATRISPGVRCAAGAMSFGAETLIRMADGSRKRIADVKVGELVLTTDPVSGKQSRRAVTRVWVHTDRLSVLRVAGEAIETTEDHPFWNATEGTWRQAKDLRGRDLLLSADGGSHRVVGLQTARNRLGNAFNLTVAGEHTYHVGRSAFVVHNASRGDGLPCAGDVPPRILNSSLGHAGTRAAERAGFATESAGRDALKGLGEQIRKTGFPEGTIPDTRPNRVLVPFTSNTYAVYQIRTNGAAVLRTVLERRP